jgi:hypothetical protein
MSLSVYTKQDECVYGLLPGFALLRLLIEADVALVATRGYLPFLQRLANGAVLLLDMRAANIPTMVKVRQELTKALL